MLKVLGDSSLEVGKEIEGKSIKKIERSRPLARNEKGEISDVNAIHEDLSSSLVFYLDDFNDMLKLQRKHLHRKRYGSANEEVKRSLSEKLKLSKEDQIKMELERLADESTDYSLSCCALTRMGNKIKGVIEFTAQFLLFDQSEYDPVLYKTNRE